MIKLGNFEIDVTYQKLVSVKTPEQFLSYHVFNRAFLDATEENIETKWRRSARSWLRSDDFLNEAVNFSPNPIMFVKKVRETLDHILEQKKSRRPGKIAYLNL